jgi:hypothetical protein
MRGRRRNGGEAAALELRNVGYQPGRGPSNRGAERRYGADARAGVVEI